MRKSKSVNDLTIIILIIIILAVIVNLKNLNKIDKHMDYHAREGLMDLSKWDPREEEIIKLNGQWEFYPGLLLEPEEIKGQTPNYIDVPGSWEDGLDKEGSPEGSGTYRLTIQVPKDTSYAIKTRTIRLANKVFLNGDEVIATGRPALDRDDFIADSKYKIGGGNSQDKKLELIIQVSNHYYRTGGIIRSIEFGQLESIIRKNNRDRALDGMAIATCLILSIYFLIIYLQRRKEAPLFHFSMISLFTGLHLAFLNEQYMDLIWDYTFVQRYRMQIGITIMTAIFLLKFTHEFFKNHGKEKVYKTMLYIDIIALLLCPFTIIEGLWITQLGMEELMVLLVLINTYIYIVNVLIKAIYHREDSLEYIIILTSTLFLYWTVMGVKSYWDINIGNTQLMLILTMLITVATMMSHRLQADYKSVNKLTEKLLRQDKLKDEFVVKVSHELRTPLHIILNLTKGLIEGQKGSLKYEQQEDMYFIHQEGQRLSQLVVDLLDASHINSQGIKLRTQALEAYPIVDYIIKEMEDLIPHNKSLALKNKIPINLPLIKADPDKFRQIIYNLVDNGIKYTRTGTITLTASSTTDFAEISITDTGRGIEKKYLEEVFHIFFQSKQDDQAEPGLGLGLSMVKQLVEGHGGHVEVESVYGRGSTFRFTLPLYKEEINGYEDIIYPDKNIKKQAILERQDHDQLGNPTILIADGDLWNQGLIIDIIKGLGFNYTLAASGRETLDIIGKNKIDLIILDFMLPDMRGDEICREIRRTYSMVELPILILTGSGSSMDLVKAFDYGANDFQRKPLEAEEVMSRVQSLLLMKNTVERGLEREFQYFTSQISPHFLHNTLNTIIGLSYIDKEEMRKALNNLSIYFRGKLDIYKNKGPITLEAELELVEAYLEIEKMRYGDRLDISYDLAENLNIMIPPLTLQPLVENSIKHGRIGRDGGVLKLNISISRREYGFITIEVRDNGLGISPEIQSEILEGKGKGIGLKNVMDKVKILKGGSFILKSEINKGTSIKLNIPE